MKKILHYTLLILVISLTVCAQAQQLIGLDYNDAIKKHIAKNSIGFKSAGKVSYATPPYPDSCLFFDDFSNYPDGVYPNPLLWSDNNAFVNQTFADSCVSIGVITLDAMDKFGNIYAKKDIPVKSDILTSKQLSLNNISTPLYLSFFVEGGGKGEAPDKGDSLILEYSNAEDTIWIKLWDTTGYESHSFKQIILPIVDSMKSSYFMFRFRNITSLDARTSPGGSESGLSNADMWHLDYIQIKKATSIQQIININDIAFTQPLKSPYYDYTSIPYSHLSFAQQALGKTTIDIQFRLYFPYETKSSIPVYRSYESWDTYKGKRTLLNAEGGIGGFENNEFPMSFSDYSDSCSASYNYNEDQDYGQYELKSFFEIDKTKQYLWNDTIKRKDVFTNYYAYDDGTAELGFGMPGSGGYNMRLAYQYKIFRWNNNPDTLTAIDIHFNKSRNNAQSSMEFRVGVWSDRMSEPGDTLYLSDEFSPYIPDSLLGINEFQRIPLTRDLLVADTIYIGIVQLGTDFINIGYDVNNNSISKMFTNGGNNWQKVSNQLKPGSLMIRPVFGHKNFGPVGIHSPIGDSKLTVYPNPANDYISIAPLTNDGILTNFSASIIDLMGRKVLITSDISNPIYIGELQQGIYFIQVEDVQSKKIFTQKFLKTE